MRAGSLLAVATRGLLLVLAVLLPSALPATSAVPRTDLVLLVVAAVALVRGPTAGLLTGLAGGWLVDLVPPGAEPLGASALVYAAVGSLLGLARRHVAVSPVLPWLAAVTAAGLVLGVRAVSAPAGFGRATAEDLWWSWVVTAVAAAVLLPLLVAVERRTDPPAGRGAPTPWAGGRR